MYSTLPENIQADFLFETLSDEFIYPLPRVIINIKGVNVNFIVDSGANRSYISENIFEKLGLKITHDKITFQTANKTFSETSGAFRYEIKFRNFKTDIKFHVSKNIPVEGLLGMDFLSEFSINLHEKILIHKSGEILRFFEHEKLSINLLNFSGNETDGENNVLFVDSSNLTHCLATQVEKTDFSSKSDPIFRISDFNINPNLKAEQLNDYIKLIKEYKDVFTESLKACDRYLGPEKYVLELTTDVPQRGPVFQIPECHEESFNNYVKKMLENDFIEPCDSSTYDHG